MYIRIYLAVYHCRSICLYCKYVFDCLVTEPLGMWELFPRKKFMPKKYLVHASLIHLYGQSLYIYTPCPWLFCNKINKKFLCDVVVVCASSTITIKKIHNKQSVSFEGYLYEVMWYSILFHSDLYPNILWSHKKSEMSKQLSL